MPVTFPAHQGLIAPIKLRWPNAIDATALCIGAAAPDLAYPLGPWLNAQSHTAIGLVVWSIPVTLVAAMIVRWRAASGIFAAMPDLGPLRLRSYRVLRRPRPPWFVTLASAIVGSGSHVLIDGFTHTGRFGATWLGMNETLFSVPVRGEFSAARILQYVGHVGGSLAFVLFLVIIASSGRLERWYGADAVRQDRQVRLSALQRYTFWTAVVLAVVLAAGAARLTGRSMIFLPITVVTAAMLVAGATLGALLEHDTEDDGLTRSIDRSPEPRTSTGQSR